MLCYAEPVSGIHGVLCWASGFETAQHYNMNHNYWFSLAHHDSQPLEKHITPWFRTTGSAYHTMIHNHWLSIARHYSQPYNTTIAEPVVLNHGVLCWPSGCESWCALMSQWLWIMVCFAEPVVVNHGVVCWTSGCESWWHRITHSDSHHWLSIANHDSQPLVTHSTAWFTITGFLHDMMELLL
jgi:hypothetical protein